MSRLRTLNSTELECLRDKKKVVILFSGGIDSTLLLWRLLQNKKDCYLLHFNYGQAAAEAEKWSTRRIYLRIKNSYEDTHNYRNIHLHNIDISGAVDVSQMNIGQYKEGSRVVFNRNGILLSLAVNYACAIGVTDIVYGAVADDVRDYPDCRQDFVDRINAISTIWGVNIHAPYISMTKKDMTRDLGNLPEHLLKLTSSCYSPIRNGNNSWQPCYKCNSCLSNGLKNE